MRVRHDLSATEARDFLRWYLRHLIEEKFAPFLVADREERLWHAAHAKRRKAGSLVEEPLAPEEAAMLRFLAGRAGGWYIGTGGVGDSLQFVPMRMWLEAIASSPRVQTANSNANSAVEAMGVMTSSSVTERNN